MPIHVWAVRRAVAATGFATIGGARWIQAVCSLRAVSRTLMTASSLAAIDSVTAGATRSLSAIHIISEILKRSLSRSYGRRVH